MIDGVNNQNSSLSSTVKAGVVGAGAGMAASYATGKYMLKHPDKYDVAYFTNELKETEKGNVLSKFMNKWSNTFTNENIKMAESGKVSLKNIGKYGLCAGILVASIYPAIKALFAKKEN
ncbi:MAG: hypothetical protein PHC34_12760 [Candidatus Gastranaerophilales bacterium]|nr:hypothetical protein [Candidatus Gastranaerophilales bacterium]